MITIYKEDMNMVYGAELVKQLKAMTGDDELRQHMISLIENGGCSWFPEYATLDGTIVKSKWGTSKGAKILRVEMPNGKKVTVSDISPEGLAEAGIQYVECKRPAWIDSNCGLIPSAVNFATGEEAPIEPIEIRTYNF